MNDSPRVISLNFRSDNVASVAPEILRALDAANHGLAASYGDDEYSVLLNRKLSDLFETEVTVFPVSTGTAANALSLATCARPYNGSMLRTWPPDAVINCSQNSWWPRFCIGTPLRSADSLKRYITSTLAPLS